MPNVIEVEQSIFLTTCCTCTYICITHFVINVSLVFATIYNEQYSVIHHLFAVFQIKCSQYKTLIYCFVLTVIQYYPNIYMGFLEIKKSKEKNNDSDIKENEF